MLKLCLHTPVQGRASGKIPTQAVHAPARWCRGRADVQALDWCGVRYKPQRRPREQLTQVLHPTVDVTTDVISIVLLERRWRHDVARQDTVAKAGGEALDLGLDTGCHVVRRAMRHVTVGPGG